MFTGHKVVREDYAESRIRIAFRPHDARFEVTDAAIEKDPEFLPTSRRSGRTTGDA